MNTPGDDDRAPEAFLPLTPLSFDILLALVDRPRHGYGVIKEIEGRAGQPMKSSTGTLYLAIQRLEDEGLLEESPEPPDPDEHDSRRRYYRLTTLGRSVAAAEARRLAGRLGVAHEKELLGDEGSS